MGLVTLGPPSELILKLAERYDVRDFIETGTYYGKTAVWAASFVERVTTIEYSKEIYETNLATYGEMSNVDFVYGDSGSALKTIIPRLNGSAIFWLDSHWSGGETYGKDDECPLLEELQVIGESAHPHFILIDDARMFTSPPPLPHSLSQWPSIAEVLSALKTGGKEGYTVVIQDVIITVPEFAREFFAKLCQEINTEEWERNRATIMETLQEYGNQVGGAERTAARIAVGFVLGEEVFVLNSPGCSPDFAPNAP